ncbi:hypothetical protein KKC04_04735 [Patescibacteria group bacterium]|nr:hypothetical protein [Patescibacteria group bacterium]
MTVISQSKYREIIQDFAKTIKDRKVKGAKPEKTVIFFRNEAKDGIERDVYKVPTECLRYRKYNGRILSDIKSYEANHGVFDEKMQKTQNIISEFLERKDPENTNALMKSIEHAGQLEPAIITCDGFLINGNRRKMVFNKLYPSNNEKYGMMKVVILPNVGDEGGPPTIKEIEHIENRYQLQRDGKSEYYGFDMALSIKRKIDSGLTLKEQLRDDPRYIGMNDAELKKIVKKYERDYLFPLECVDRYLESLGRMGLYDSVSTGVGDKEGRWQAFIDYGIFYKNYLSNEKWRIEAGIEEDEIGDIEDMAFKIIRKREVPSRRLNDVIRDLKKFLKNTESKKLLTSLEREVDIQLPHEDYHDKDGNELSTRTLDIVWGKKYNKNFAHKINAAYGHLENQQERETPLTLLEAALKKLNHDNMDLKNISVSDQNKAMKLARAIKERANELESEAYQFQKDFKSLKNKKW